MDGPTIAALDNENPWPGLASYDEEGARFFFGRKQQIGELFAKIQRETLTVLFGKSGLGKSSLLKAGLSPVLRAGGFFPIYLRIDYSTRAPRFLEQLLHALRSAVAEARGDDVQWSLPQTVFTAWELFHAPEFHVSHSGAKLCPVLILDQFEELFTLGVEAKAPITEQVLDGLETLAENRVPSIVRERLQEDTGLYEYFNFDADEACRIILSLREDFLAAMEPLRQRIPKLAYNRMRLEAMNGENALQAIIGPGHHLLDESTAFVILDAVSSPHWSLGQSVPSLATLRDREVNPALLSLLCSELNQRRRDEGRPRITVDLVRESRDRILRGFYDRCFEGSPAALRHFVEDCLVTLSGYRRREEINEALALAGASRADFDRLAERRLLRYEDSRGATWVELTHDLLTDTVVASRRERKLAEQVAAAEAEASRARSAERLRRRQALALGFIAALLLGLSCTALNFYFDAKRQRKSAEQRLEALKRETEHASKLSLDKQQALLVASRVSDTLTGLAGMALEDKDNGTEVISPIFKNLLLAYIHTVELKAQGDAELPPEIEVNLEISRILVNLITRDLTAALDECDRLLHRLPHLRLQDLSRQEFLLRLKGDILDENAFRARSLPTAEREKIWFQAMQAFQQACDEAEIDSSEDAALIRAQLQTRIAHVINFLAKLHCSHRFHEVNDERTASGAEPAAEPDRERSIFLDYSSQVESRLRGALAAAGTYLAAHRALPPAQATSADMQNKLGNVLKERVESGFVDGREPRLQLLESAAREYERGLQAWSDMVASDPARIEGRVALALVQANLAETYETMMSLGENREPEAIRYLDARIATCETVVRTDPNNPYLISVLRRGLLNKISHIRTYDQAHGSDEEARHLLTVALFLDPQSVRHEDLADFETLCRAFHLEAQYAGFLEVRDRLLSKVTLSQ